MLLWLSLCALTFLAHADEAPSLLLAKAITRDVDVTAYLVSEKLDGVRAFWDGHILRTRHGNVLRAPAWFVERLPEQLQAEFLSEYERRVDVAYPARADGHRLLAFPRMFLVAQRQA